MIFSSVLRHQGSSRNIALSVPFIVWLPIIQMNMRTYIQTNKQTDTHIQVTILYIHIMGARVFVFYWYLTCTQQPH